MTVQSLDELRPVLGGSTIAAAAGIDPWCSRVELFYRLRGDVPTPDTEAMQWGRLLQPLIFHVLREQGTYHVAESAGRLWDGRWPWLRCNPDGFLFGAGEPVESKVTAIRPDPDALPLPWQAQLQTYMHVIGAERGLLAVLSHGTRLDTHTLFYDPQAATRLFELAADFVGYVRRDECPPPDGSQSARDTIGYVWPTQEPGKLVRLLGDEWEAAKELRARREQRDAIDKQVVALENRLKIAAGDAETLISPHDQVFATWKATVSRRIDTARLREERGDFARLYETESTTRRFIVK